MSDLTFKVGDRVTTVGDDSTSLKEEFRGLSGVVTEVLVAQVRVKFDTKESPEKNLHGWLINKKSIGSIDVSDDEVAQLFGIQQQAAPSADSTLIELLEHVDNGLRNGTKMTRANLAFEFLLKHLELTRLDLPSYVHDMQES